MIMTGLKIITGGSQAKQAGIPSNYSSPLVHG